MPRRVRFESRRVVFLYTELLNAVQRKRYGCWAGILQADLKNETETIRNYRQRVRQCEAVGEYAMAELVRGILVNEQEHQIDLATALGIDVPRLEEIKRQT